MSHNLALDAAAPLILPHARWGDYVKMARLDHMTKHVFILPGIVLAWMLLRPSLEGAWLNVVAGFLSAVLIASANYIINEWLDREFDAYHPDKSKRPAVNTDMSALPVYALYAFCSGVGIALGYLVGTVFFITTLLFWVSGVVYNVKPIRSKDKPYLDVLSESLNNPIRMMLGWGMIAHSSVAPASLLAAYWMAGAFLMGTKRLSEYREITSSPGGVELLHRYRRSFQHYTQERLTISVFVYALLATLLIGFFAVKYRIEYMAACPLIIALFAHYLNLSMRSGSVAQKPEKLFREKKLMALTVATVAALAALSVISIPAMQGLTEPHYIFVAAVR